jgi:hypothetical protein
LKKIFLKKIKNPLNCQKFAIEKNTDHHQIQLILLKILMKNQRPLIIIIIIAYAFFCLLFFCKGGGGGEGEEFVYSYDLASFPKQDSLCSTTLLYIAAYVSGYSRRTLTVEQGCDSR